jgi:pyridoxal phosphate enzyme (YggS family)
MIKENILRLRGQIPESIAIVAVSKGRIIEQIKEVIEAGVTEIGENRVQEAIAKFNALRTMNYKLRTHMVGHLQTNKVKDALNLFDLIQSVDSLNLAQEIDRQAAKIHKIQDILIEVKTSPEATKFGLKPDETVEVIKEMAKLKNINIKGLMTIAPIVDNPEKTRPYFKTLRILKDKINSLTLTTYPLTLLSMGMTDDFEIAIEEGSNMVRIGRAIFESAE